MNNQSQRDAFWEALYDVAKDDHEVIVISADMGAPALDLFKRDLPGQFLNVGIAEQNAITIAAGLSLAGKKVFAYAIAPFITLRCLEQIRVENAIMNIPITIVGVGAGFGYPDSGPTHHLVEDIAVMRAFPHITINSMTDGDMSSAFARLSCAMRSTNYVRLERQQYPDLYEPGEDFSKGLAVVRNGVDICMVSTGSMVHSALRVADVFEKKGVSTRVVDCYTFPIDPELFLESIKGVKKLISLEEHFLAGGLGSAVCEILSDRGVTLPLKRIGLPLGKGYCYQYGGREVIRSYYGISEPQIERTIGAFIEN